MRQSWHDLLFMHRRVDADAVRARLPGGLELDTFDGEAWLGVVPFRMTGIRLDWFFAIPGTRAFAELNVRTYVSGPRGPGVWFFSLDAASPLAVAVARRWFHLPYFNAEMDCTTEADAIHYVSVRTHRGAPPAEFAGRYAPTGPAYRSREGDLGLVLGRGVGDMAVAVRHEHGRGLSQVPSPTGPFAKRKRFRRSCV